MATTPSFTNPTDANPAAPAPASAPAEPKKMIKISNNGGPVHQISERAASQSAIIMDCISDMDLDITSDAAVIPLFMDVSEEVLTEYIIPFLEGQHDDFSSREAMIFAIPSAEETCQVLTGANYLAVEPLVNAAARAIADQLMGLTTEEMRAWFGIENDLTPQELAQLARDNEWTITRQP
jgi:hypothetical protein